MKTIIFLLVVVVSVSRTNSVYAQLLSNDVINPYVTSENAFLDASSFFDKSMNGPSSGKGLVFPRTNLTEFGFITNIGLGSYFPTYFDGMIVYNVGTGYTPSDQGVEVSYVTPGFYFFSNLESDNTYSIAGGRWIRLTNNLDLISKTVSVSDASPVNADDHAVYFNTTDNSFYKYDKGTDKWNIVSSGSGGGGSGITSGADLPTLPDASLSKGDAFFETDTDILWILKEVSGTKKWISTSVVPSGADATIVPNPVTGNTYYNISEKKVYIFDGTVWQELLAATPVFKYTASATNGVVTVTENGTDKTGFTIPVATTTNAGLMVASDKSKLDNAVPVIQSNDANKVLVVNSDATAATWKAPFVCYRPGNDNHFFCLASDTGVLASLAGNTVTITIPAGVYLDYFKFSSSYTELGSQNFVYFIIDDKNKKWNTGVDDVVLPVVNIVSRDQVTPTIVDNIFSPATNNMQLVVTDYSNGVLKMYSGSVGDHTSANGFYFTFHF